MCEDQNQWEAAHCRASLRLQDAPHLGRDTQLFRHPAVSPCPRPSLTFPHGSDPWVVSSFGTIYLLFVVLIRVAILYVFLGINLFLMSGLYRDVSAFAHPYIVKPGTARDIRTE